MSFIRSFHRLRANLVDTDRGVYADISRKLPQHIDEDDFEFYAKVIAYLYCFSDDLQIAPYDALFFGASLFTFDPPSRCAQLVFLGGLERKTLLRARRELEVTSITVFLYSEDQLRQLTSELRSAKENWVEGIEFFMLDGGAVESVISRHRFDTLWDVHRFEPYTLTIISRDTHTVLNERNATEHQTDIEVSRLDIWMEYQRSLQL